MREFPDYFADAEQIFDDARFVIFGVPYDSTSSFRFGSRLAPAEIRKASWNFESFDIFTSIDLSEIPIHDLGNLEVEDKSVLEMVQEVERVSERIIRKGKFPIALGGEHSISIGVVEGLKDAFILVLDAHLDFRERYEDNPYSHACTIRRITDRVGVDNVLAVGIRSAGRDELDDARREGLRFMTSRDLRKEGAEGVMDRISGDKVYISLDFDVIDPSFAPGVSTPEPFGLRPDEVIEIIKGLSDRICGFDLVEVCPAYDTGITSVLAAKIVRMVISEVWKNKYMG